MPSAGKRKMSHVRKEWQMNFELSVAIVFLVFCWSVKLTMEPGYDWLGILMKLFIMVISTHIFLTVLVGWIHAVWR